MPRGMTWRREKSRDSCENLGVCTCTNPEANRRATERSEDGRCDVATLDDVELRGSL
ncbi:hypothetical protein Syun_007367 [Stephania yunnanensis]|uniref:Uncharacterized protein n=1 Tax=Stephania yunnanensis TaxID=152371 RepID=A0AAP0KYM1_9MAGN